MQKNTPTSKSSTFSNYVYRTNHRFMGRFNNNLLSTKRLVLEPVQEPGETPENPSVVDICTQTNFRSLTSVNLNKTPRKVDVFKERCTQTSRTVITLEEIQDIDISRLSPDSLSPHFENKDRLTFGTISELGLKAVDLCQVRSKKKVSGSSGKCAPSAGGALTKAYLERNKSKILLSTTNHQKPNFAPRKKKDLFKSQSYVEPNLIHQEVKSQTRSHFTQLTKATEFNPSQNQYICSYKQDSISGTTDNKPSSQMKEKRSFSFMSPTISSERKDQRIEIECIQRLISPTKRGRSISPRNQVAIQAESKIVPYIDKSQLTLRTDASKKSAEGEDMKLNLNTSCEVITCTSAVDTSISNTSTECALFQAIAKLKDQDWNKSLRGLAEIVEISRLLDPDAMYPHMTAVNQRLIELIKSPRSHVCRTSCQAVGHIFEYVKDTRRPEFDELVDTLLAKTADANKFIRRDANLALDCMVTHIPTFHAVRAICSKGPDHKNPLVRTAAARLLVCAVVLAGPQNILNPHNNEYSRRRIIVNMVKFLDDRCREIRKYGERLYKLFYKDRVFDSYLKRYLEKEVVQKIKLCIKPINGQKL